MTKISVIDAAMKEARNKNKTQVASVKIKPAIKKAKPGVKKAKK